MRGHGARWAMAVAVGLAGVLALVAWQASSPANAGARHAAATTSDRDPPSATPAGMAPTSAAPGDAVAAGTTDASGDSPAAVAVAAEVAARRDSGPAVGQEPAPPWQGKTLDWLVLGGGPTPASNQASLEADGFAAQAALRGQGATLFAGGYGSRVVAVDTLELDAHATLRQELAALLAPDHAVQTAFRAVALPSLPADARHVEAALQSQWHAATTPLLVVVSGHGERADNRDDVRLPFWGGAAWTPRTLTAALDGAATDAGKPLRPLRFVIGACFSGGFAEILFRGASAQSGPSDADRCGLFASTWDLESSGCDADPDRRHHEGYARVFWAALQRRDVDGGPLEADEIDFDHDGAISLLEAHSRVRIASTSFDIPTSTSERWLRVALTRADPHDASVELGTAVGLAEAPSPTATQLAAVRPLLVEEFAVVAGLARTLRVADPWHQARTAWEDRDELVEEADDALAEIQGHEQGLAASLGAALLRARPELQDAWHPAFESTLRRDGPAIAAAMHGHPSYAAWRRARHSRDAASRLADRALVARALAERLLRAVDNVRFAVALRERGGQAWQTFLRLRACERTVPPLRAPDPGR